MKKSLLELYALAVCFVTVTCFAVCLGTAIYDIVEITNPEFTLNSSTFEKHQGNDSYTLYKRKDYEGLSDEEITKMREASYKAVIKGESRSGFQSLIQSAITMLIAIVVFIPHWLIAKRTRKNNAVYENPKATAVR